jgi:hypothetical protein
MNIGIVELWNPKSNSGTIVSDGIQYHFSYEHGQSVANFRGMHEPRLSGGSISTPPFAHKVPRIGDPVIFHATSSRKALDWGYACHYVTAAERAHGTEFRTQTLARM